MLVGDDQVLGVLGLPVPCGRNWKIEPKRKTAPEAEVSFPVFDLLEVPSELFEERVWALHHNVS